MDRDILQNPRQPLHPILPLSPYFPEHTDRGYGNVTFSSHQIAWLWKRTRIAKEI